MVVGGKPHIRPCTSIPSDGNENNDFIASIGELYAPLTTPLPLVAFPAFSAHVTVTSRASRQPCAPKRRMASGDRRSPIRAAFGPGPGGRGWRSDRCCWSARQVRARRISPGVSVRCPAAAMRCCRSPG